MSETTVVNVRKAEFDVYIGRRSVNFMGKKDTRLLTDTGYGNPFVIGRDGTRTDVITKYRAYLLDRPGLIARLPELQGQALGCWCAPAACHGHVLALYADTPCDLCDLPIWEHEYEGEGVWRGGDDWKAHGFTLPGEKSA